MQRSIKISHKTNVRSLWRAVIMQALVDATTHSKNRRAAYHKRKAKDWLNAKDEESFVQTCLLAEMEPNYVRMKLSKVLK